MIGILHPCGPGTPGDPASQPIGRAMLELEAEGVAVVLGEYAIDGVLHGFRATPDGYTPAQGRPRAVYDRYPSQSRPEAYAALCAGLEGVPIRNAPGWTALLRDKAATMDALGSFAHQPQYAIEPAQFADCLDRWGAAFAKPRHGSFGRGVRRIVRGEDIPERLPGAVPGSWDEVVLQQAIEPPAGYRGVSCRVLVQRTDSGWVACEPVARVSTTDWVVNAARGAGIVPVRDRFGSVPAARLAEVAIATAGAITSDESLMELGVDLVLSPSLQPWVIEVNARPRGRLSGLAKLDPARFSAAHHQAVLRPLRWLSRI